MKKSDFKNDIQCQIEEFLKSKFKKDEFLKKNKEIKINLSRDKEFITLFKGICGFMG